MNNIIDLHCDTISEIHTKGQCLDRNTFHLDLHKMSETGYLAQCFALFIDIYDEKNKNYHSNPWQLYKDLLKTYKSEIIKNSQIILPALNPQDLLANKSNKKMSSILTVEDGALIDNRIERIAEMFNDGVRLLTLTWNYENSIGYPNSADDSLHKLGLKPFGVEVIHECNRLGILIDVSHLSEGGFYDVAKYSSKPFLASHSCSRSLCNHQRNLDDKQLRTIAKRGGLIGINFFSNFLKENETTTYIDDIIHHMRHIYNICGIESLAWGTDFDGIDSILEFKDASGFPKILNELQKYFTDEQIDKINSENFIRVWRDQQ